MRKRVVINVVAINVVVGLALAGCSYDGDSAGGIERRASWFSYVGADDLRNGCVAGAPERYRLVYNGIHGNQVRTYDVVARADRGAAVASHVLGSFEMGEIVLFQWGGNAGPASAETAVTGEELRGLRAALDQSGFFEPPPAGLLLPSREFYWVVSACVDGKFHFNAWLYPSPRYARLAFVDWVLRHDGTGVAYYAPRLERSYVRDNLPDSARGRPPNPQFSFLVGRDRLLGASSPF